jgi:hypothetical protein
LTGDEFMEFTFLKIVLIVIAGLFYFLLMKTMNAKLKKSGRVAQFKVGGRRRFEENEESSPDQRKVSLRNGPHFKRRFR